MTTITVIATFLPGKIANESILITPDSSSPVQQLKCNIEKIRYEDS